MTVLEHILHYCFIIMKTVRQTNDNLRLKILCQILDSSAGQWHTHGSIVR